MGISEQVKKLKVEAEWLENDQEKRLGGILRQAADTIESLSEKLADMGRSAEDCGGGWIKISDRLPTMEECQKNGSLLEV